MNNSAHFAPRYEALFRVSDCLRAHQDIQGLFRALPFQLHPVVDFNYMSVFLNADSRDEASWFVPDDDDHSALTAARDVPIEQAHVSWAFEHQQPAIIGKLDGQVRFSGSSRLLSERGLQSGCAVPITTAHRRLGAMFLGSAGPCPGSDEEVRFLSFVADRIALAVDDVLSQESRDDQARSDTLFRENRALREGVVSASMFDEIVGSSEALNRVLAHVTKVAPTDATVLITGETGTGKELIARAIHERSNRSSRAFVRVNCAAIPPSLIASELFGYEKGAFTGAGQRHVGRFELANGGTILLDEIGDIPAETQIALLRVLQEREFERVGGTHPIPIDVRVLAATNSDLNAAVDARTFRLDLFYRLSVFPIQMPSLRERPEDILLLATYFIERYASKAGKKIRNIERRTLEWLQAYDWPGNIRELQNVVERAVILCDGETFSIDETWLQPETRATKTPVALAATLANQERGMIKAALEESRGRISGPLGAAGKLGMPRSTLESKIKSLRINKHQFKYA
ncbi:MAG: sigma54 specific transcriptional regulator, Fis family [Bryobacterales bacterium]|nr:sigma54 specific transcriptional regulator, Fis family [Bryobacterales bacterium]